VNWKSIGIGCLIAALISAGALVVLLLVPIGYTIVQVNRSERLIRKVQGSMCDPKVYEPVGRRLVLYCQSDQSLFPRDMNYAWLPQELNQVDQIGHGWVSVGANEAQIEMGGGFHHFGYRLVNVGRSTLGTNVWQLYMCDEGAKDRLLQTIALPSQDKLSSEALLQMVVAGFDGQIQKDPRDDRAHKGKIQAYLRFNHVPEARQACKEMLKAMPDDWWAVLVNALVLTEERSVDRGTEVIIQWVNKDENFFRYMDLAYFYHLTRRPREAAKAIVKSTNFNADTLWGEGGNSEFRGYTAAMCAYRAGDYEASLKLCDHLLPVKINGDYAKQGLRNLKAASEKAMHGQIDSIPWAGGILPFDAFEDVDIAKLLAREVPRPTEEKS